MSELAARRSAQRRNGARNRVRLVAGLARGWHRLTCSRVCYVCEGAWLWARHDRDAYVSERREREKNETRITCRAGSGYRGRRRAVCSGRDVSTEIYAVIIYRVSIVKCAETRVVRCSRDARAKAAPGESAVAKSYLVLDVPLDGCAA